MSTQLLEQPDTVSTDDSEIEHGGCYGHEETWCGMGDAGELEGGHLGDYGPACIVCMNLDYCTVCGRDLFEEPCF